MRHQCPVEWFVERTYLEVGQARLLPELLMIKELVRLSPQPPSEQLKILPVTQLHKYANKEAKVTRRVHKMASGAFIFWFPNLQHHCLCKHLLGQFGFHSHCRERIIWSIIIDNMGGLLAMLVKLGIGRMMFIL